VQARALQGCPGGEVKDGQEVKFGVDAKKDGLTMEVGAAAAEKSEGGRGKSEE